MTEFEIRDIADSFAGRFQIVVAGPMVPTAEQARLIELVDWLMERFSTQAGERSSRLYASRDQARARQTQGLRDVVALFVAGRLTTAEAIEGAIRTQGQWEETLRQSAEDAAALPFLVQALDATNRPIGPDSSDFAHDLRIIVRDRPIAQEKLRFKVEIDRTLMVIKVILPTDATMAMPARAPVPPPASSAVPPRPCVLRRFLNWLTELPRRNPLACFRSGSTPRAAPADVATRRSSYIRKLAGIARVGLETSEGSLVTLATQSLEALREEIVAMEASKVKNRYLWRLGVRCLCMATVSVVGYLAIGAVCPIDHLQPPAARMCSNLQVPSAFRNFFLLAAGTAVGTWLSFSLRRVILTFLDLASLEDDRLDPTIRVLFITALASVVGLLFWTEAITVGIGKFSSSFAVSGTYALLIGLLLGIAERTMSTSVFKRATDFAGAVGGR
jgi:hypothetical protein